jgi:hypothetical protein
MSRYDLLKETREGTRCLIIRELAVDVPAFIFVVWR